jgi:hypothetical protein
MTENITFKKSDERTADNQPIWEVYWDVELIGRCHNEPDIPNGYYGAWRVMPIHRRRGIDGRPLKFASSSRKYAALVLINEHKLAVGED